MLNGRRPMGEGIKELQVAEATSSSSGWLAAVVNPSVCTSSVMDGSDSDAAGKLHMALEEWTAIARSR